MKIIKRATQAGCFASFLIAINACNAPDSPTPAVQNSPQVGKDAEILYSENFADSGKFMITKDASGGINYNVQARIGSNAEKLMAASSTRPTLVEVYQTLHEGQGNTPAVVTEISNQLGSREPAANDALHSDPAARALPKTASQNGFSTGYCRDIHEGSYIWKWLGCFWLENANYINTPWVNSDGWIPDRVYAWNATPYTATLSLWNNPPTSQPNTWRPTLQPYWVTWFQWGGTYSNALAYMQLPAGKTGELGIVSHYAVPYVR
jgi:hypothetical protein